MSFDAESPNAELSEFETQFVPRSNDDEVLWEVVEIVAERGRKYQVRWAGNDPKTGKPWPLDWVPKRDCTLDLVKEWKKKKAQKRQRSKKTGGRPTTKSRSTTVSIASTPSASRKARSVSEDNVFTHDEEPPRAQPSTSKLQSSKRKRTDATKVLSDISESPEYPKKKRKLIPGPELVKQRRKIGPRTLTSLSHPIESDADTDVAPVVVEGKIVGGLPATKRHIPKSKDSALSSTTGKRRVTAIKTTIQPKRSNPHDKPVAFSKTQSEVMTSEEDDSTHKHKSKKSLLPQFSDQELDKGVTTEDATAKRSESHSPAASRIPAPILHHHRSPPPVSTHLIQHQPILSPGARARLEIFDRMMGVASDHNDANIYENTDDGPADNFEPYDLPPNLPPKFPTPPPTTITIAKPPRDSPFSGVVPETDSSQSQRSFPESRVNGMDANALPPPKPPSRTIPPSERLQSMPPIAIMPAPSSSGSPTYRGHIQSNSDVRPRPRKPVTRPIPRISPQTFRNVVEPFTSALDNEPPMSSIESFSSPRKDKGKQRQPVDTDELHESSNEESVPGRTDAELRAMGKSLYEQAVMKKGLLRVTDKPVPKKTLADVARSRAPMVNDKQLVSDTRSSTLAIVQQMEDAYVDLSGGNSTTIDTFTQSGSHDKGAQRIILREEVEESTQEALLGGNPALPLNVADKPEVQPQEPVINDVQSTGVKETRRFIIREEAEGTQEALPGDLLVNAAEKPDAQPQERVVNVDICSENDDVQTSPPIPAEQSGGNQSSTSVDDLHVVSMIVNPSQGQLQERDDEDIIIDLTSSPTRSPQNNTDMGRLNHALAALNRKSDEIEALQHELTLEREKCSKLENELTAARQSNSPTAQEVGASSAAPASPIQPDPAVSELANECERWEGKRNKLGSQVADDLNERGERSEEGDHLADQATSLTETRSAEHAMMMEAREALTADVARLNSSLDAMTRSKALAETDRDFFRDQYMQASGFVSITRAENVELEQKAAVAEGRARDGVALIKSMFESQIKVLKEDADRWRGVASLLQEKDRLTNNAIRQRAAEHPELVERCRRLEDQVDSLHAELELVHQKSSLERNKLLRAFSGLRERGEKLDLCSVNLTFPEVEPGEIIEVTSDRNIAWTPDALVVDMSGEEAEDDECGLYPCKWKTGATVIDQCQQAFDCREDLDRHMYDHHYCHQIGPS